MAYSLQAFICRQQDFSIISDAFNHARKFDLKQGIALIPMTAELYSQMNSFAATRSIRASVLLPENIENALLRAIGNIHVGYVEADYFGGRGGQEAIVWKNNKRDAVLSAGPGVINKVLKGFGVIALQGIDEFDTLDFGSKRKTNHWLNNYNVG
ncbi:MAG: hypothetical protein ABIS36_20875 [Chryseolinea sp.]